MAKNLSLTFSVDFFRTFRRKTSGEQYANPDTKHGSRAEILFYSDYAVQYFLIRHARAVLTRDHSSVGPVNANAFLTTSRARLPRGRWLRRSVVTMAEGARRPLYVDHRRTSNTIYEYTLFEFILFAGLLHVQSRPWIP